MRATMRDGKVHLDFGEHGSIALPPAVAQALVSSERLHAEIRQAILKARGMIRGKPKPAGEAMSELMSL